ncbi:MAG: hypothetical protein J7L15_03355, partial [Clostridiales bacterium]|nr:hypothetical protein [Clostridiales bacterium]
KQFKKLYDKAFEYILFNDYDSAKIIIKEIEKNKEVYEHSTEVINYTLIQCLYYAISNVYFEHFDFYLKRYEIVLDFFSSKQKQLYYFIKGLDFINNEQFADARENFEKALSIGDAKLDVLIKDYYVIGLGKSNKFVDSRLYADECIKEFESQTNYIRAMRLRTRIAFDYYRINKFEESEKMYKKVLAFSTKYKVKELENRCNSRLALLSIVKEDYTSVEYYIGKVPEHFNKLYYYIKLDLAAYKGDDKKFEDLYNKYMGLKWNNNSQKTKLFFECMRMRYKKSNMIKSKYESNLNKLIKLGLKADDAEMIESATRMLTNFYRKERKYKQAYETSLTLLHYLKNGAKQSEYNISRVTRVYSDEK